MILDKNILDQLRKDKEFQNLLKEQKKARRREMENRKKGGLKGIVERVKDNKAYGDYTHHRHVEATQNRQESDDERRRQAMVTEYIDERRDFLRKRFRTQDGMSHEEAIEAANNYLDINFDNETHAANESANKRMASIIDARRKSNQKKLVKKYGKEKAAQMLREADPFTEPEA